MAQQLPILVVDDDQDTCTNLTDILGDLGYRVHFAYRGWDALDLVAQTEYALALLDFKLPCMTGVELFHRLRAGRENLQAVIVTAFASPVTEEAAARGGVRRLLSKPVDLAELMSVVREIVGEPG